MIMKFFPGRRKEKRLTELDSIVLKDITSGKKCYAEFYCMSCRGMYFEADCAFKSGDVIHIQFNEPGHLRVEAEAPGQYTRYSFGFYLNS